MRCAKVRFRDKISADLAVVRRGRYDHRREKTETRSYQCRHCGSWHLTSQPYDPEKQK